MFSSFAYAEVRVAEEILIHPDRTKALDVVRKKLYERAHMLHPSVTSLNEKDYQARAKDMRGTCAHA